MQCKIINFEKAPVDRKAIESFLDLLPSRLSDNLHELAYRPADDLDFGNRLRGTENHQVRGLHYNQDGKSLLVIVGPVASASDYEKLSFVAHLKSALLKLFTARVPWNDAAHRELAHCALSVSPSQATHSAWQQALANRLYSTGHDVDRVSELCDQAHSLLKENDYDVARSVYGLSDWQRNAVKNLAGQTVKNMIKKSIDDSFEKAKLMHAIFSDGEYDLETGLLDQLRMLVDQGDPHRVVAVRHFANALNEI